MHYFGKTTVQDAARYFLEDFILTKKNNDWLPSTEKYQPKAQNFDIS